MQDISKKEERKQMLVEERVNIQALHDMLIADQQDAFFEKKVRYTAPLIMQSLIKRGYFKDEYISDEWLSDVKLKVKSNMYQVMGEWDRAKYSSEEWKSMIKNEQINQVKCEVYKHIIKNEELFTTIMNNIKAEL